MLLNGHAEMIIDSVRGIEFASKSGRDDEPINRTSWDYSGPKKVEDMLEIESGKDVWPERYGHWVNHDAKRSVLSVALGDGVSDILMLERATRRYGVSFSGDAKQLRIMEEAKAKGFLDDAVMANFAPGEAVEAVVFDSIFEFAARTALARRSGIARHPQIMEMNTHPGTTNARAFTERAQRVCNREHTADMGTAREHAVDAHCGVSLPHSRRRSGRSRA